LVRNEALPGALAEDQIGRIALAVLTNGIAESRQVCERIAGRSVERPRGGHRRYVRALRLEVQLIKLVAALVGAGRCAGLDQLLRPPLDGSPALALQLAEDGERLFRSVCDESRILDWILAGAWLGGLRRADGADCLGG